MSKPNEYRERLLAYLAEFGLDGSEISDEFTLEQYRVIDRNNLDAPEDWRDWPSGPDGIDLNKVSTLITLARAKDYHDSKAEQ